MVGGWSYIGIVGGTLSSTPELQYITKPSYIDIVGGTLTLNIDFSPRPSAAAPPVPQLWPEYGAKNYQRQMVIMIIMVIMIMMIIMIIIVTAIVIIKIMIMISADLVDVGKARARQLLMRG